MGTHVYYNKILSNQMLIGTLVSTHNQKWHIFGVSYFFISLSVESIVY